MAECCQGSREGGRYNPPRFELFVDFLLGAVVNVLFFAAMVNLAMALFGR